MASVRSRICVVQNGGSTIGEEERTTEMQLNNNKVNCTNPTES